MVASFQDTVEKKMGTGHHFSQGTETVLWKCGGGEVVASGPENNSAVTIKFQECRQPMAVSWGLMVPKVGQLSDTVT